MKNFIINHKIAFSIIVSILLLLILLIIFMFTIFSLQVVDVALESNTINISKEMEEQIKSEIEKGGTVFFKNKQETINNIEQKYPYVKVVNIETVIPNKFVIHIVEREELYYIKSQNNFFILDEDLKILNVTSSLDKKLINLNFFDLEFDLTNAKAGQTLNLDLDNQFAKEVEQAAKTVLKSYQKYNNTTLDFKALCKSINFSTYNDYRDGKVYTSLTIIDYNDFNIVFYSISENFDKKMALFISAYAQVLTEHQDRLPNSRLVIYSKLNGEISSILEKV